MAEKKNIPQKKMKKQKTYWSGNKCRQKINAKQGRVVKKFRLCTGNRPCWLDWWFFFVGALVSVAKILKSYEPLIRSESRLYHLLIR